MLKTTDYARFEQDQNRPMDKKRAEKLLDAIAKNDLGELYPIVVRSDKGRLLIVDGQHRFYVRSTLELPIYYIVTTATTEDIRKAESMHKDWSGDDYVNYYANQGKEDYQRLVSLMNKTGWAASNMLVARESMSIKKGELSLSQDDVSRIIRAIFIYEKLVPNMPFKVERRCFYAACWRLAINEKFNLDELAERVKLFRSLVYPCQRFDQYFKVLQTVYNYRRKVGKVALVEL